MVTTLPSIPAKRYFTIGEVAQLCGVKPHVLRYWEQEFTQLRPMKRRGNRRYYQHHEVLMIRRIRELLYDQGFTITGARNRLQDSGHWVSRAAEQVLDDSARVEQFGEFPAQESSSSDQHAQGGLADSNAVRKELFEIRALLSW